VKDVFGWVNRGPVRRQVFISVAMVIAAAAVITILVWPVTDLLASHDLGSGSPQPAGPPNGGSTTSASQTAHAAVRTQMLTLAGGMFAAGALVYTARNYALSRSTFSATEQRVLNERFAAIAEQLGHEQAAVRLAAVYAMAGLADDWETNRQTCINILCAYMRLPYPDESGEGANTANGGLDVEEVSEHPRRGFADWSRRWRRFKSPRPSRSAEPVVLSQAAEKQVRFAVTQVITARLQDGASPSWQGMDFNFRGVVFDCADFLSANFSSGIVDFSNAKMVGPDFIDFSGVKFSGATVRFHGTQFCEGSNVLFSAATFSAGEVDFFSAKLNGGSILFYQAMFTGARVRFFGAELLKGSLIFLGGTFAGGTVDLCRANFGGADVDFREPLEWSRPPFFPGGDGQPYSPGAPGRGLPGLKLPGDEVDPATKGTWSVLPG
jgi:hypothetical protein